MTFRILVVANRIQDLRNIQGELMPMIKTEVQLVTYANGFTGVVDCIRYKSGTEMSFRCLECGVEKLQGLCPNHVIDRTVLPFDSPERHVIELLKARAKLNNNTEGE